VNATTRELVQRLALDEHASTLRHHPSTTIRPTLSGPDSAAERAMDALAAMPSELVEGALDFMEVIGEGGMAVVSLAAQRSVGRPVAVKALRPELRSPHCSARHGSPPRSSIPTFRRSTMWRSIARWARSSCSNASKA
jgi:hypothetical protein